MIYGGWLPALVGVVDRLMSFEDLYDEVVRMAVGQYPPPNMTEL